VELAPASQSKSNKHGPTSKRFKADTAQLKAGLLAAFVRLQQCGNNAGDILSGGLGIISDRK